MKPCSRCELLVHVTTACLLFISLRLAQCTGQTSGHGSCHIQAAEGLSPALCSRTALLAWLLLQLILCAAVHCLAALGLGINMHVVIAVSTYKSCVPI